MPSGQVLAWAKRVSLVWGKLEGLAAPLPALGSPQGQPQPCGAELQWLAAILGLGSHLSAGGSQPPRQASSRQGPGGGG